MGESFVIFKKVIKMKLTRLFSALALFLLFISSSFAQNGKIRGTVIDETSGQPLFTANVVIAGTTNGTSTDFDGKFELSAAPGTYNVQISFIGLATVTIEGIQVKANDVTVMNTVSLKPASTELKTYNVTAKANRASETAIMTMKKKSVNVLDGISAQTIKKAGDSDAAAAVKRVPGVSIQGGKYVFVRGLGDRYTKTQLNGMDVPGLDPDRNSLQMDIFPTNVIDNLVVLKSFTADLPADFTGGIVNIETKDFPEEPNLDVSASVGFTPGMHFNGDYLSQETSSTDFLGFDDGLRDEPLDMSETNQDPIIQPASSRSNATEQTKKFNTNLAAKEKTSLMNFSLGLSGGNQYKKGDKTYGLNGAFSYKNNTKFYEDYEQNFYFKELADNSVYELSPNITQKGNLGINNVFLSGMLGGAIKTDHAKYRVSLMHLQNGETKSGYFREEQIINNSATIYRDNLEYSVRSISNMLISGTHHSKNTLWEVNWKLSPTYSRINDKDVRITPYLYKDGVYSIDASEASVPQRLWRNLNEFNVAGKIDLKRAHQFLGYDANIKFGTGYTFKTRSYEILNYNLESINSASMSYTGDADELLTDEFIWTREQGYGFYQYGNYQESNKYEGIQTNLAAYISEEFQILQKLKGIAGVRMEKYDQYYTGMNQLAAASPNQDGAEIYDNEKVLDLLDFFPTLSLIYQPNDNTNVRGSYFRTTARPSFKEKSTAEIVDVISKVTFIGNIDLQETDIDNFDLRYEYFMKKNQTLAVSAFYKMFKNPIELASYAQDVNSVQPRNVGDAEVLGIELETRINFSFITDKLENLSFNGNFSWIESRVKYDKGPNSTYEGKQNGLREGEDLGDYRDMQGQAPYIINAGISYKLRDKGLEAGLFYNVQGPKLIIVGINRAPDVYSVPFHSLNFNLFKTLGKEDQYQIGLGVSNILDDAMETETESYKAESLIYSRYNPGRTFSFSIKYSFY
tara:strand:+ start:2110 stop:5016 length:2907 start_codon:yes stop_codon:yes gene_type:complete